MKYETQKVKNQYRTARIAADRAKEEAAKLKLQLSQQKSPSRNLERGDDAVSR